MTLRRMIWLNPQSHLWFVDKSTLSVIIFAKIIYFVIILLSQTVVRTLSRQPFFYTVRYSFPLFFIFPGNRKRACEKTKVFSCVLFLINTTVIIFHKKAYNPPSPMRMPLWILCGSCNFFLLVVIFIKIVSDRNEKYFKQYRFYSSSDNSFVPPVVFHDTKGTFCLNGSVHP